MLPQGSRFRESEEFPDTGQSRAAPSAQREEAPRGTAPLDTYTGFAATPMPAGRTRSAHSAQLDPDTGELVPPFDPAAKWELQARARKLLPDHKRLWKCHYVRFSKELPVEIRTAKASGKTFYGGLMVCGLVWLCPVCAAKVQKVRADELHDGLTRWTAGGGAVELVTYTVPHGRSDRLQDLDGGLRRAYRQLTSLRAYKALCEELGVVGSVVSPEVTWGPVTGWHPHLHVLRFRLGEPAAAHSGPRPASTAGGSSSTRRLFELWRDAVDRTGLGVASAKAFRVQDATRAARYLTKMGTEAYTWRTSDELARSHSKRGREGRMTPFDFLRSSVAGTDGPWRQLWREYAETFRGRRQLRYSPGLRDLLGSHDRRTDEQVAASVREPYALLQQLSDDDWQTVRAAGARARGELLQVAELHGTEGVRLYIAALAARSDHEAVPA